MSAAALAREIAAVGAAAGVGLLLAPLPRFVPPPLRRAAALAVLLVSWAVLAGSLIPSEDASSAIERLSSPAAAAVAALGVAVAAALAVLLVRLVLSRPWVWFLLLGLALPVRFPITLGSQSANLLVPLYVVILVGLAAWVWGRVRGRLDADGEAPSALDLPIAAFVCFSLVSTLWSADSTEAAVKAVFFYVPFVLLYRLVLAWWRRADALRLLVATTVGMAVPVAVLALGQYATRTIFWNDRLEQANIYSRFFRVNAIFYDPNILGRYLVLAILAAIAVSWAARRPATAALALGAAAVCAAGLVVTFSRSSALGLMVALTLMAARAFGWRPVLAVGGSLAVLLSAGVIAASTNVRRAVTSTERLERVSEGRFDLVRGGLEIWADEPVLGTGLGAFAVRYREELTPAEQLRARVFISHNAPVTVLTEVGLVGFALFVALGAATVVALRRSAGPVGPARALAAAGTPDAAGWGAWTALALLAAIFVHSLLYSALFEDPYTWVVTAAGIALGGVVRARSPHPAPAPARAPDQPAQVA
jgi:O-antigen ligase